MRALAVWQSLYALLCSRKSHVTPSDSNSGGDSCAVAPFEDVVVREPSSDATAQGCFFDTRELPKKGKANIFQKVRAKAQ